ncbi:hypothetical protein WQ54_19985 [Bacillus sp. SA1-12]|uniref:hypothetical protein n=1 Tax=Bacillus sp. SA1-12 TaxID=1455638 RepID=UPI000627215C|nr:hypothetical protein [Bacillus sp. SA1-12]KKI90262.1 hypothetical protein WQ54_19985 [Bacillus sp. SA1-12]
MLKLRQFFIILVLTFPILISFDSTGLDGREIASYQSPEGIRFVSYSKDWGQAKLIDLYHQLLKNKHGKEIYYLQEVTIIGGTHSASSTKGSYHALTSTITLYQGDTYTNPADYNETLSHEYGHHFAYFYFPSHHLPFSEWLSVRGLKTPELQWDAFWNYNERNHAYYPQEIFADDYVLLFGATNKVTIEDIYNNEAFYLRTEHENSQLPNVLENSTLHSYLEEESGIKIDESRLLQLPKLADWNYSKLSFHISDKPDVAYRLNIEFHQSGDSSSEEWELYEITTDKTTNIIDFSLEEINQDVIASSDYVTASIDVVDLSTSIGFETEEIKLDLAKISDNHM